MQIAYCIVVFSLITILSCVNFSYAQPVHGIVGGTNNQKGPFDDCKLINDNNALRCQNWNKKQHHGNNSTNRQEHNLPTPPSIPGSRTSVNSSTHHPSDNNDTISNNITSALCNNNGTVDSNCSATSPIKSSTSFAATTTPTTQRPTTTLDLAAAFFKLGISTEQPEVTTTTNRPTTPFNETYNLTHLFNITTEEAINVTEIILDRHPDLPASLLKSSVEIEQASYRKPAIIAFDRVSLTKCQDQPHPVSKLIYFLAKSQILGEYLSHQCDSDYSDYCKKEWSDCKEDGKKLCPKTCKITDCAATRFFGYVVQDKPTFKLDPCKDDSRYNCTFLKVRGDCLSGATSMVDICSDTCHFCLKDQKYLPWMPEYRKMLVWLHRYDNGKYGKYAQVIALEENSVHKKAINGLC